MGIGKERELFEIGFRCFRAWNAKLKLDVYFRLHCNALPKNTLGEYRPLSRQYNFKYERFGEIVVDISQAINPEELCDTIKHEICHALCDLRYNTTGHGEQWIRLAKLFGVKHNHYIHVRGR